MEADIRFRNLIPPRPSSVKDLSPRAVTQSFNLEESIISNIINDMKLKANAPTTGHWPLDRPTHRRTNDAIGRNMPSQLVSKKHSFQTIDPSYFVTVLQRRDCDPS